MRATSSIPRRPLRCAATALGAAVLVTGTAPAAGAQGNTAHPGTVPRGGATGLAPARADTVAPPPARPAGTECFGFSFGAWTPPLDWRAAGHGADSPGGRLAGEFASRDSASGGTQLLLFPSWWPAGVGVRFARAPGALGDTVAGVARAFVADGRLANPRATVRAWLKPCGTGGRT